MGTRREVRNLPEGDITSNLEVVQTGALKMAKYVPYRNNFQNLTYEIERSIYWKFGKC